MLVMCVRGDDWRETSVCDVVYETETAVGWERGGCRGVWVQERDVKVRLGEIGSG